MTSAQAAELRAVMQAVCDMEVSSKQAIHMIRAAAGDAEALKIDMEQFKGIIHWRMPTREEAAVPSSGERIEQS